MKVQVDLIDEHDARPICGGVVEAGVGLREATREIEDERERATFAVRELTHGDLNAAPLDEEARPRRELAKAQLPSRESLGERGGVAPLRGRLGRRAVRGNRAPGREQHGERT